MRTSQAECKHRSTFPEFKIAFRKLNAYDGPRAVAAARTVKKVAAN